MSRVKNQNWGEVSEKTRIGKTKQLLRRNWGEISALVDVAPGAETVSGPE